MLLNFRVANFRSLTLDQDVHQDEEQEEQGKVQELSLVATDLHEHPVRETGLAEGGRPIQLHCAAGIFGANASGKSNVLAAMTAMREAVTASGHDGALLAAARQPYAVDGSDTTTFFEVSLLLDTTRYTYGFELSDEAVEAEWLHAYPNGRRQVWFDREPERTAADGGEYQFPSASADERALRELAQATPDDALFLPVAAKACHPQAVAIRQWFTNNLRTLASGDTAATRREARVDATRDLLLDPGSGRTNIDRASRLLIVADLGITGIDVDPARPEHQRVRLLHSSGHGHDPVALDLDQESSGTRAFFGHIGPLLSVLEDGSVLLADDLDVSLHPAITAEIVDVFSWPEANPHGAQLIFTAHDAALLRTDPLGVGRTLDRDQVWITAKRTAGRGAGRTELYPLIDARPRTGEDIERGYLLGRYGGTPKLSTGELARNVADIHAARTDMTSAVVEPHPPERPASANPDHRSASGTNAPSTTRAKRHRPNAGAGAAHGYGPAGPWSSRPGNGPGTSR